MPSGFFPAVEPDAPVQPLLDRLRPAVQAEVERHDGLDVTVHAELRAVPGTDGDVALKRFYWSTQQRDPTAPHGFGARTLYCAEAVVVPAAARVPLRSCTALARR